MPIPKKLRAKFVDKEFADSYADEFLSFYIATQLKVLREQRQLTQQKLAELAGMKQERISVLENVNYSSWSISTLRKFAAALGVTLRVSFETFGSRISEMESLTRKSLQRASREEELRSDEMLDLASIIPLSHAQNWATEPQIANQVGTNIAPSSTGLLSGFSMPTGQTPGFAPVISAQVQ